MTKEASEAIEKIKEFLKQETMLYNPDYSLPFYLATDASNCGMGSMLYQIRKYDRTPEGRELMLKEMGFEPEDSKTYTFIPGVNPGKSCPVATNFLSTVIRMH
jgi:hypothetical protein